MIKIKDVTFFGSNYKALPFISDGEDMTFYHDVKDNCYVGIDIGENAEADLTHISYLPNLNIEL